MVISQQLGFYVAYFAILETRVVCALRCLFHDLLVAHVSLAPAACRCVGLGWMLKRMPIDIAMHFQFVHCTLLHCLIFLWCCLACTVALVLFCLLLFVVRATLV